MEPAMQPSSFRELIRRPGFPAFLWTQFLGAFNDNVYKIIVSMRAVHVAAAAGSEYLSLAGAVFVAPFLLFSGYSGHLADAISKRTVLISVKVFEIFVMSIGFAAFYSNRMELMLLVLFLMALHSTVFSPAKYGIVPEMLPDRDLSRANGLLEMSTFMAIVLGTSIGTFLFVNWKDEPWKMGLATMAVAVTGFAASLRIPRVPAAGLATPFQWNPFSEIVTGTRHLLRDRPLWLTVLGISYFWFLGALFQMDLLLFGSEVLHLDELRVGLMVTALAIGIGAGSMLAGRLSGDQVELGLVPLGSILMAVCCVAMYAARESYGASVVVMAALGVASGLFIVPLNAFLQQRAGEQEKGRLIATNNFFNTIGILLASAILWGLHDRWHVTPDRLILIGGIATIGATAYIVTVVPDFLVRFVLYLITHTVFKIRVEGQQNVPLRGPALLVANHMSHVDGLLIGASVQRFVRFLVWRPYFELRWLQGMLRLMKAIPIGAGGRRETVESLQRARQVLEEGHVVCIFAEGAISRTGNLLPFKKGFERIAHGLDVPVIPVHLDRLWGSIFSFERGKFFWKWPKRVPYPVTVTFGPSLASTASAYEVRQAIQELGSAAAGQRKTAGDVLPLRFVRTARRNWSRFAMADSTGRKLTFGEALTGGVRIADWLRVSRPAERMIGILLPSSVGGALANIGVTLDGRVPVNLNYTTGREALDAAAAQCGIRTILTSRAFLAKAKIELGAEAVYLEDLMAGSKLRAWLKARLLPRRFLVRGGAGPDSLSTVIFSSGSTGVPKGVMLSHYNVISNLEAMAQVFWITDRDRIAGVLPFFHSFGFTVTLWLPLLSGCGVVYHPNPLDAKGVGALIARYHATFLLATPTFCSHYARKCEAAEFSSLRFALVGAEKLRQSVAQAFEQKFGLGLLEGYGATEMAPAVAVNCPDFEAAKDSQTGAKHGTVGHPLPGVSARVVDPDTFQPLPPGREGLLLVKGPNRMLGYLNRADLTDAAMRDGWYVTGDIAALDEDGFVRITDRLSRFSKIAGEMVPHIRVEEAISTVIGEAACAVTGVPDEQRGERLVAFYTDSSLDPHDLWRKLSQAGLPPLWLPKPENLHPMESLPLLATGKLDLRAVKAKAVELETAQEIQ